MPVVAALIAALAVPPLTGPVVDQAGVIDPASERRLEELAQGVHRTGGPQLGFITVRSLEGEAIEDFSIRVAEKWQLGSREKDDGIIFVVAVEDRRMRIEVGQGIEGEITDAQSGRIVRDTLAPAFRAGRYGEGLFLAARQAVQLTGAQVPGGAVPVPGEGRRAPRAVKLPGGFLCLIVLFFLLQLGGGRRRRLAYALPFLIGGGRGGGGFGGGGGYRGGGGGFSGGGASGSW